MPDLSYLNWWAVIAATVVSFLLGALWYSPVMFGNAWMREHKLQKENLGGGAAKAMILTLLATFVSALGVDFVFSHVGVTSVLAGTKWGLGIGVAFVAMAMLSDSLFARQSLTLYLIQAGYRVICLGIMGAIISWWPW